MRLCLALLDEVAAVYSVFREARIWALEEIVVLMTQKAASLAAHLFLWKRVQSLMTAGWPPELFVRLWERAVPSMHSHCPRKMNLFEVPACPRFLFEPYRIGVSSFQPPAARWSPSTPCLRPRDLTPSPATVSPRSASGLPPSAAFLWPHSCLAVPL